ncbi:MAG: hypothetical protein EOP84_06710 [Verrucomicrobiaceae bacterium]|nr:MAG: hypothetical protein EOP84_06710 [Verrucomicrobiaceae bacterium]
MRFLHECTMPPPGRSALRITPATALYVFEKATSSSGLKHFAVALLARENRPWRDASSGKTWESVFEQVPELEARLEPLWGLALQERNMQLQKMGKYMCTLGEVGPEWFEKLNGDGG